MLAHSRPRQRNPPAGAGACRCRDRLL